MSRTAYLIGRQISSHKNAFSFPPDETLQRVCASCASTCCCETSEGQGRVLPWHVKRHTYQPPCADARYARRGHGTTVASVTNSPSLFASIWIGCRGQIWKAPATAARLDSQTAGCNLSPRPASCRRSPQESEVDAPHRTETCSVFSPQQHKP